MQPDYYQILGISNEASASRIRQAYRNKAKLFHPDINKSPDAKTLFQLINEAYHVLADPEKKRWYDFKLKYPSTTGVNAQRGRKRSSNHESRYRTSTRCREEKQKEKKFVKYKRSPLDNFLFGFLITAGALAIIFSVVDIFSDKLNMKNTVGTAFGVWFLLIMFYGWNLLWKK